MNRYIVVLKDNKKKLVEANNQEELFEMFNDKILPEHPMDHVIVGVYNIDNENFPPQLKENLLFDIL